MGLCFNDPFFTVTHSETSDGHTTATDVADKFARPLPWLVYCHESVQHKFVNSTDLIIIFLIFSSLSSTVLHQEHQWRLQRSAKCSRRPKARSPMSPAKRLVSHPRYQESMTTKMMWERWGPWNSIGQSPGKGRHCRRRKEERLSNGPS